MAGALLAVDAFRSGRKPADELEAVLAAVEAGSLQRAAPFVDADRARTAATAPRPHPAVRRRAHRGQGAFERVEGWPASDASLVFADRVADHSTTMVRRLEAAGVVKVGQTAASEFGGLNVSTTKLHGVTHNPWQHGRTARPDRRAGPPPPW